MPTPKHKPVAAQSIQKNSCNFVICTSTNHAGVYLKKQPHARHRLTYILTPLLSRYSANIRAADSTFAAHGLVL